MITVTLAKDKKDLEGIKQLQQNNLSKKLSKEEAMREGFLSAEYSTEFLKIMHDASPSVIAKDGEEVVGYALVAVQSVRQHHELLADLFNSIDTKLYKGLALKNSNYVVVGQLCVAKAYRGQGLVQKMYEYFKDCLSIQYDYCITDVASDNPRSLKAHLKTGFTVIDSLNYGGISWNIVLWDWKD